ncbi:PREDICTED: uncharacterized protein LOC105450312 [Wasmannia auropunctata]|uniref:uncharacterized protein LOC105450312 n=1 Tax=Wasmannia auropunctata TaxID=64793 RepID=UPI0005EF1FAD|nr:PREDICTED: uncharacterized protein LOC105450312 [Wasmannia auropunctata]
MNENIDVNENSEAQESMRWLQSNQMPWELVLQHWHKTFSIRRVNLEKSKENTLNDTFSTWPILKHPHGYSLIIDDFQRMALSQETLTVDKWDAFFHQLKSCVKPSQKDDQLQFLMETLLDTNINEDSKIALQIMILPHLFPPKKMTRRKDKYWRPSIWDAKDSIIKHAVIPGDVTKLREEYVKKCKELKLTIQPYIFIIGPTLHEITTCYLCVDDVLYNTSSLIEAVDACFKTFHVLQLQYPTASDHLWLIIQKCIYKFTTKWDRVIPSTEYVIKTLNEDNQLCDK